MNTYKKIQIDSFLRRQQGKLTISLVLSRIFRCIFLLYVAFSIYLLVVDTTFITEIKLYENDYISLFVCGFAVIVGFVLLLLTFKMKINYIIRLLSVVDNYKTQNINVNSLFKYIFLKFSVKILKIFHIAVFIGPSLFVSVVAYDFLKNGVVVSIISVLIACDVLLFLSGLFNSFCIIQKYSMCDFCFVENQQESVVSIINSSSYLMDGRCEKTAKHKIRRFVFILFGFFVPVFSVREDLRLLIIMTDKIIPYVNAYTHTEKSVVFYVGKSIIS